MHRPLHRKRTILLFVCAWLTLAALSSSGPGLLRADDAIDSDDATAATPGVLLTRSGWLVRGKILKTGDVYRVEQPNGNMAVPVSQVRMRADSLNDLYRKLRARVQDQPSAETHLALARWCLSNKLISEAKREAQDALTYDAQYDEARDLLKRIDRPSDGDRQSSAKSPADSPAAAPRTAARAEATFLAGLDRDEAREFTQHIQPLLLRNCAVAGCHAAGTENGFRLHRVGPNLSRTATEENLAQVLQQIDFKSPRNSALVTIPDATHGQRRGRPAFSGTHGKKQLSDLRQWVQAVARTEALRKRQLAGASAPRENTTHAAAIDDRPNDRPPMGVRNSVDTQRPPRGRTVAGPSEQRPAPPRDLPPVKDPFDPAAFNRSRP